MLPPVKAGPGGLWGEAAAQSASRDSSQPQDKLRRYVLRTKKEPRAWGCWDQGGERRPADLLLTPPNEEGMSPHTHHGCKSKVLCT